MIFRGFIGRTSDGRTRVFLDTNPHEFIEVQSSAVASSEIDEESTAELATWIVDIADDAEIGRGVLEPAELDELFAWVEADGPAGVRGAAAWGSRPGITCGAHDPDTKMGICTSRHVCLP